MTVMTVTMFNKLLGLAGCLVHLDLSSCIAQLSQPLAYWLQAAVNLYVKIQ